MQPTIWLNNATSVPSEDILTPYVISRSDIPYKKPEVRPDVKNNMVRMISAFFSSIEIWFSLCSEKSYEGGGECSI